jgi:hypothetical protein
VEPGNLWLSAQVKAVAFYGCFNSVLGYQLGGFFLLAVDLSAWALLDELVCLALTGGKQS